jgi:hypothetical protein
LAQRSRKRGRRRRRPAGRRSPPPQRETVTTVQTAGLPEARLTRAQLRALREDEARARLTPLAPGERPWPLLVGVVLATASGLGNLIAYAAGTKIAGKHPAPGGIIIFSVVMLICAAGMWRHWYPAVLGFMALLVIVILLFSLFFIEASNALGFLIAPLIVLGAGFLLWKFVGVLGRIQLPEPPRR